VAAGLAAHLGVPVVRVRLILILATFVAGAGAVFYLFLWLAAPAADRAGRARTPALSRLAPRLRAQNRTGVVAGVVAGVALVALALLIAATRFGAQIRWQWLLPAAALVGGVALAWSQLEKADAGDVATGQTGGAAQAAPRRGRRSAVSVLRLLAAVLLIIGGIALLMGRGQSPATMWYSLLAGLVMVAGVAIVLAPWWLRLIRSLGDERAARAREAERADVAAHLHDSVLQTLNLLRQRADEPETVRRLARAQERELRDWLYADRAEPGTSLAAEVKARAAEVEDLTGVEVGLVIVGDAAPTPALEAMVQALREALYNACRHGAPPVSLYLEVEAGPASGTGAAAGGRVEAFVRDKGPGFDLADVPEDRLGVRGSIIGRMERHGGTAEVRRARAGGTEVHLQMPLGTPAPQ
jgi:signal transduction histidine kinase